MRVEDCKPGAKVRYRPIIGSEPSFVGTVRLDPWQLGHGAWVTHLEDLDRPEKPYVHAALVEYLELVSP